MSRINITIDDNLKSLAENHAKSLGLSLSSFIRLLLTSNLKSKSLNGLEKGLIDLKNGDFEVFDGKEYLAKLDKMIKNANS